MNPNSGMFGNVIPNLQFNQELSTTLSQHVLTTLLIVLILWGIYLVLRLMINRRIKDVKRRYSWQTRVFYTILIISVYLVGRVWFSGLQDVFTFLSIVAAALTITQKESIMNMVGCVLIYWRELFHTGDRVRIQNFYGEVTSIRTFYFHLLECDPDNMGEQITGRIIKIPNSLVITSPVINYTEVFPFAWYEFKIIVSRDTDPRLVKQVLHEMINQHIQQHYIEAKHYLKRYVRRNFLSLQTLTTESFINLHQDEPGGYEIAVRFLCLPKEEKRLKSQFLIEFLNYMDTHPEVKLVFMDE